jgi:outer membrane protein assembly factor BamD
MYFDVRASIFFLFKILITFADCMKIGHKFLRFGFLLFLALIFNACSEYQKALKSEDPAVKLSLATKLYDEGKYQKAIRLFEQVIPNYRGKPQGERLFFMNGMAYYNTKQYYLAAYQLETFSSNYPRSEKVEEAAFLSAVSYSKLSPRFTLDQADTFKAIDKFQNFINAYPNSLQMPEANRIAKELREKVERKVYENAILYNKIARFSADHLAAITTLDNFIEDYPGTPFKEDAMYFKFDSAYKLAMNSVERKKLERLKNASIYYKNLVKFKPDSKYRSKADTMHKEIEQEISKMS